MLDADTLCVELWNRAAVTDDAQSRLDVGIGHELHKEVDRSEDDAD